MENLSEFYLLFVYMKELTLDKVQMVRDNWVVWLYEWMEKWWFFFWCEIILIVDDVNLEWYYLISIWYHGVYWCAGASKVSFVGVAFFEVGDKVDYRPYIHVVVVVDV